MIISSILLIPTLWLAAYLTLPDRVSISADVTGDYLDAFYCTIAGLICGLIIGLVTELYTSHSYKPV